MTTAFILWGGGSLGAAQVGMLRALTARGIQADIVVGASVGALNAAYYAGQPTQDGIEDLANLWLSVGAHDVYPLDPSQAVHSLVANLPLHPVRGVLQGLGISNYTFPFKPMSFAHAMLGHRNHVFDNAGLRAFLDHILPITDLEDSQIPLSILTTDVRTGKAVVLSRGSALEALLASTAIPAIYPNVTIDGKVLMDGALADKTTLDYAVSAGVDEVYLLAPGHSVQLPAPPSSAIAMALHGYNLLDKVRIDASIRNHQRDVLLHVLPALSPVEVLPIDFGQTADLIERATELSEQWLNQAGHRQRTPSKPPPLTDSPAVSNAG